MLQRGRKPTATVVPLIATSSDRPEPPNDLTRDERKVWRDVVNSKPANWFDRDTAYLLVSFCRHVVMTRRLSEQIEELGVSDVAALEKLLKLRAYETKSLLALANAMRISQAALAKAATASTASEASSSDKPWLGARQA